MLNIPRVSSVLATVTLESFFFGIYLIVTATALILLLKRRAESVSTRPGHRRLAVLLGISALFLVVAGHWVNTVYRFFFAFVYFAADGINPMGFYSDWAQPTEVLQTGFLMASLTIMDALIVHRLWIIWGYKKRVVVFPLCTLFGLLVSGVGVTYEFSRYAPGDEVWPVVADHWIIADCAFTILTNLYCTGFMAYRLWRTDRIIRPLGGPTIMSVLRIIIESTALSAGWCIFFIAAYSAQSNLRFLVDITPSVVGALNMLVYMRTGMGWNRAQESDPAKQVILTSFIHSQRKKLRSSIAAESELDSVV
ncbi:hypothetical protein DFH08DRAFT_896499 [Mycena albidolilacea]|uniref:Uncharacterized protein n=1 Tax=Mycena albidolilacea TaxID=1033008 RepID=A0AAD7ECN8_9AGAR|nr:hypothetical protein DFH08DRAFT_896499 [Mycena albidolilacea]